jgi:hypothetical protein
MWSIDRHNELVYTTANNCKRFAAHSGMCGHIVWSMVFIATCWSIAEYPVQLLSECGGEYLTCCALFDHCHELMNTSLPTVVRTINLSRIMFVKQQKPIQNQLSCLDNVMRKHHTAKQWRGHIAVCSNELSASLPETQLSSNGSSKPLNLQHEISTIDYICHISDSSGKWLQSTELAMALQNFRENNVSVTALVP